MKIYQVAYSTVYDGNHGYDYCASKIMAERQAKMARKNGPNGMQTKIEVIEVEISKRGILRALNLYAGHPDNG